MTEQRPGAIGVRFKEAGKVYYFDAGDAALDVGNYVVVETSHGLELGRVVIAPGQVLVNEIKEALKPILRVATPEDRDQWSALKRRAGEELREAKQIASDHGLDMQIVSADYDLNGDQLTLYFTAPDRVDFRPLVRELSSVTGSRVQVLQVGDRDRAKLLDGYDVCGQRLCCSSWQTSFPAVSIKMAKEQDLPLNPQKISGVCGRLYCCLTFEYEGYREIRGTMPKVGSTVSTPSGEAKVNSINTMKKTVTLWLTEARQLVEMPAVDLQLQYGLTVRPVELVQEIEAPLKQAPAEAPLPAADSLLDAGDAARTSEAMRPSGDSGDAPAQGAVDGGPRRRRGRRGGRNRRREGGTPPGEPQP